MKRGSLIISLFLISVLVISGCESLNLSRGLNKNCNDNSDCTKLKIKELASERFPDEEYDFSDEKFLKGYSRYREIKKLENFDKIQENARLEWEKSNSLEEYFLNIIPKLQNALPPNLVEGIEISCSIGFNWCFATIVALCLLL
jgi:cell division protein FtsB